MGTITENAWALIPGYDTSKKILDGLGIKKVSGNVDPFHVKLEEPTVRGELNAEVEALLAAGEDVPDDIGSRLVAARERDALAVARVQAMNMVARKHGDPASLVSNRSVDRAFGFLRSELNHTLDAAVDVAANLDGATTAEEAIRTTGPANAWKSLTALASDYDEIRAVQFDLTRRVVAEDTGGMLTRPMFEAVGLFADALDVHPYWLDLRTANCIRTEIGRGVEVYCDWMSEQRGQRYEPTGSRELDLVRLATETTPWMPTPDEFTAARIAAETAVQPPLGRYVDRMEQARASYYKVTGATPIGELTVSAPIKTSSKSIGTLGLGDRFIA